jgi:hypothetical protein
MHFRRWKTVAAATVYRLLLALVEALRAESSAPGVYINDALVPSPTQSQKLVFSLRR